MKNYKNIKDWDTPEHRLFENVFGFLQVKEGLFLNYMASLVPIGGIAVEIGSYMGRSAVCICSQLIRRGGRLFAIDPFDNSNTTLKKEDTYESFLTNIKPYSEIITPVRKLSHDALKGWNDKIDMLFIDGDHSYEGVKRDIEDWYPFLRKDGTIAFHDYSLTTGVVKAVKDTVLDKIKNKTTCRQLMAGIKDTELGER